jgi:hypothetical protein
VLARAESGLIDRRQVTVRVSGGHVKLSRGGLKRAGACRRT